MDIFRPARRTDVDAMTAIAAEAGKGMTSVARSKEAMAKSVDETARFLKGDPSANRLYFILDVDGDVQGLCSIKRRINHIRPFYSFKRSKRTSSSVAPPLTITFDMLQLTTDFDDCTEIATLLLSRNARGGGRGRLLSFGRLAYVHAHRSEFHDKLIADIRGWFDENDNCPFWDHFVSRFVNLSFEEADRLSAIDGRFIEQLLPTIPILLNVLPPEIAQRVGQPHDTSAAALKMLSSVGFCQTDLCDVFDGGPTLSCATDDTLMARSTRPFKGDAALDRPTLVFAGRKENFRTVMARPDTSPEEILKAIAPQADETVYVADAVPAKRPAPIEETV